MFLSPEACDRFAEPNRIAATVTGVLRMSVGRRPDDVQLSTLICELSLKHEEQPMTLPLQGCAHMRLNPYHVSRRNRAPGRRKSCGCRLVER
ncbi:MmyB family transcriptional regulator [Streptomyces lincolnensis]|uniref:MmyB family transcriptional regulator n=1 Tax=Streptomyces lincolnensis TaxID=1915 RepID=UPI0037D1CFD9